MKPVTSWNQDSNLWYTSNQTVILSNVEDANVEKYIPAEPKLRAVFEVNKYILESGAGEILGFHHISGLYNEYIDADGPIDSLVDIYALEVAGILLEKQNEVNTGRVRRVGTTIPLAPGVSSYQIQVDGTSGLVQNINLTDQKAPPLIPDALETERDSIEDLNIDENQGERKDLPVELKDIVELTKRKPIRNVATDSPER